MDFRLLPLPYPKDALEPAMSRETIEHHYERIHRGYLDELRAALRDRAEADQPIERIVLGSSSRLFSLAAQVYDHNFFWNSLRPQGGGAPPAGPVSDLLERSFGGWDAFRHEWIRAGADRFGSGYLWLTVEDGQAEILPTPNAETPLAMGSCPLLVVDLWEHAYYLDYRERREQYLEAFCDKLANWEFVAENLAQSDHAQA